MIFTDATNELSYCDAPHKCWNCGCVLASEVVTFRDERPEPREIKPKPLSGHWALPEFQSRRRITR